MENAMRAQDSATRLVTGLLIGGLVGFGAMMLLAPRSGSQTRDQLKKKSIDFQDRTADTFNDLVALTHFDQRKILAGTRARTAEDLSGGF